MNSYSDRPTDRAPPRPPGFRFFLRREEREIPLPEGTILVGRSSACDLVLGDPRVSAEHARLVATIESLTVVDLDSRNGVFVTGVRVSGDSPLASADIVTFAEVAFEVIALEIPDDEPRDSDWPTKVDVNSPFALAAPAQAASLEAFDVLASIIDKALAMGHVDDIAQVLADRLTRIAEVCETGGSVSDETIGMATRYALKCATATGRAEWLNLLVRIYRGRAEILPVPVIDTLYEVIRQLQAVDWSLLSEYADLLAARGSRMSPADRFATKRIAGLLRFGPGYTPYRSK